MNNSFKSNFTSGNMILGNLVVTVAIVGFLTAPLAKAQDVDDMNALMNDVVLTGDIMNGTILAGKVAANAINSAKIGSGVITNTIIGSGAVTVSKLANASLSNEHFVDGSISSVSGTLTAAAVANLAAADLSSTITSDSAALFSRIADRQIRSFDVTASGLMTSALTGSVDFSMGVFGSQFVDASAPLFTGADLTDAVDLMGSLITGAGFAAAIDTAGNGLASSNLMGEVFTAAAMDSIDAASIAADTLVDTDFYAGLFTFDHVAAAAITDTQVAADSLDGAKVRNVVGGAAGNLVTRTSVAADANLAGSDLIGDAQVADGAISMATIDYANSQLAEHVNSAVIEDNSIAASDITNTNGLLTAKFRSLPTETHSNRSNFNDSFRNRGVEAQTNENTALVAQDIAFNTIGAQDIAADSIDFSSVGQGAINYEDLHDSARDRFLFELETQQGRGIVGTSGRFVVQGIGLTGVDLAREIVEDLRRTFSDRFADTPEIGAAGGFTNSFFYRNRRGGTPNNLRVVDDAGRDAALAALEGAIEHFANGGLVAQSTHHQELVRLSGVIPGSSEELDDVLTNVIGRSAWTKQELGTDRLANRVLAATDTRESVRNWAVREQTNLLHSYLGGSDTEVSRTSDNIFARVNYLENEYQQLNKSVVLAAAMRDPSVPAGRRGGASLTGAKLGEFEGFSLGLASIVGKSSKISVAVATDSDFEDVVSRVAYDVAWK